MEFFKKWKKKEDKYRKEKTKEACLVLLIFYPLSKLRISWISKAWLLLINPRYAAKHIL